MSELIRAALHVHSRYSDGEYSLGELRAVFVGEGCRVVCLADHAEYFDQAQLTRYCEECELLSDDRLLLVPGLEFRCDQRMHIVGYGTRALTSATDPGDVIRHIEENGGVSVIAHPSDAHLPWIEQFTHLPCGIEAWNTKYDGRYAPRPSVFALIARLRQGESAPLAFYGLDLHWRHQYRGMHVVLQASGQGFAGILEAFRGGRFHADKDGLHLPSSGALPTALLERFRTVNGRSRRFREAIRLLKEWTGPLAGFVPARVKGQLRKLF